MTAIEKIKGNKALKGDYKVGEALTPVKVVGVGDKALKVLVYEASKFTSNPVWKQYWIRFKEDDTEFTRLLYKEMLK